MSEPIFVKHLEDFARYVADTSPDDVSESGAKHLLEVFVGKAERVLRGKAHDEV